MDYGRFVLSIGIAVGAIALAALLAWPLLETIGKWRVPALIPIAVYVGFPVADRIYHRRDRFKLRQRYAYKMLEIDTLTLPLVLFCVYVGFAGLLGGLD
ncbi:MAG: hypothetical protein OXH09_07070 [Gammaproteobacteria bacterium]|nr:hypothetical protein [Gammaproteobacteria bacterium]